MSGSFADSNVLLYLPDEDQNKAEIAERILRDDLTISVQVLNELAVVMLRKWRWSWTEMHAFLTNIRETATIRPLNEETHDLGLAIARKYRLHVYDSMIVASALLAGCTTLFSEDMHHGLVVEDQLTIVNPFA